MAQHAQVTLTSGTAPVNVICFNNAATAIPAHTAVLYETVAGKLRAVKIPANGAGRARTAGITVEAIPAGGYGKVTVFGPAIAIAQEAIVTGEKVMACEADPDTGKVIKSVVTATTEELGFCLQGGAAKDDLFEIFVNPATCPKAA